MPSRKQSHFSFWFIVAMFVIGAINTAIEAKLIPADQLNIYLALRIPLLASSLLLAYFFKKNPYSSLAHFLLGMLLMAYCAHGQWYRPFYEISLFQALIFYTLLFYPSKKVFLSVLAFGSILFLAVYAYRFDEVVLHNETTLNENYLSIIAYQVTLYGIFKVFSEQRSFKEQALARFGYLGKHSASILHDLKGTVAIPRIYTELAKEELAKGNIAAVEHRLQETINSLDSMQNIIARLNQMTQLAQFTNEEVNLREVAQDVQSVLKHKMQRVKFELQGDSFVTANRAFAFSFLFNLVMNSLETFEAREVPDPKIDLKLENRRLIFQDNGGGFEPKVLERIESGISASTKQDSSGLGLFLLIDGIRNMGGKVLCANTTEGASITIQFRS